MASARWHTKGRRIVYLAETPAGSLVEVLVHLEVDLSSPPLGMKILKVDASDASSVSLESLKAGWERDLDFTRAMGDDWLRAKSSALLRVPSAIVPETMNVLLNPEHPDAGRVRVLSADDFGLDERLL